MIHVLCGQLRSFKKNAPRIYFPVLRKSKRKGRTPRAMWRDINSRFHATQLACCGWTLRLARWVSIS